MNGEDKTFQFIKIIIGVIGLIFLFYCIQCGVLLTDDSYNYLHAATTFISDGKLLNRDFIPSASWPPLYSILLSRFIKAEITNFQYLQLLLLLANFLVFGGTVSAEDGHDAARVIATERRNRVVCVSGIDQR